MTETPSEFARRLGVNKSTVCRAIQEGRLLASGGKLDVADNLRRWEATKPGTRADVAARHAAKRSAAIPMAPGAKTTPQNPKESAAEPDDDGEQSAAGTGIADYRKLELIAAIDTAKLQISLRTGERFPLQDIGAHASALGATLRAALERLVDTTAARLTLAHTNESRVDLIRAETASIKRLMTKQFIRSIRALRESAKTK
jgi:hypothetical protein